MIDGKLEHVGYKRITKIDPDVVQVFVLHMTAETSLQIEKVTFKLVLSWQHQPPEVAFNSKDS